MRAIFSARRVLPLAALAVLGGCTTLPEQQHAPDEEPVLRGSAPRRNATPLEPAFTCLAQAMRERQQPVLSVAVGDVKDYTGKFSQNEGNTVTQGGALMIYSALGKLEGAVQVQERFDTRIAELELAYTDRRQLGDGRAHAVESGKPPVPWVPYFGGTILRSHYYIVGGITELNYNIASGGYEAGVSGVGARSRTYTMNVGVDLRIVDTRTLVVAKTVSLQKQVIGQEVGAGVFRFFGNELLDINVGSKKQEPLQLGVRTVIEQGVLELVSAVSGTPVDCVPGATANRAATRPAASAAPAAASAAPAEAAARKPLQNVTPGSEGEFTLAFEVGGAGVAPQAVRSLDHAAAEAAIGRKLTLHLVAREGESLPPPQRAELVQRRIQGVVEALAARGVTAARVAVSWQAAPNDAVPRRHGAGHHLVAILAVAP